MSDDQKTQTQQLLDVALERFRLVRGDDGAPYAIDTQGDIAQLLRLKGRGGVRHHLGQAFLTRNRKLPTAKALSEVVDYLEGLALHEGETVDVHIRVARYDGHTVVVDLGTGRYAHINPDEARGVWMLQNWAPVTFRRTNLTGQLPEPVDEAGALDQLRRTINVVDADWHVLVAWMIAALVVGRPVPILWLTGQQGSGKSVVARIVVGLLDPGPAETQKPPNDQDDWVRVLANRHVIAVDNASRISEWWSDALCRAVTGDGMVKRRLYTDDEMVAFEAKRPIVLTTIDAGAVRGDLAERLLPIELAPIPANRRRTEQDMDRWLDEHRPALLGDLYQLLAEVLDELPGVWLPEKPRMADFAELLAAYDIAIERRTGTSPGALARYLAAQSDVFTDVVNDDPVGAAILELIERRGQWRGTAGELLDVLNDQVGERRPKTWPQDATRLAGQIKRLAPSLEVVGVHWEYHRDGSARTHELRRKPAGDDADDANDAGFGSFSPLPSSSVGEEERENSVISVTSVTNQGDGAVEVDPDDLAGDYELADLEASFLEDWDRG